MGRPKLQSKMEKISVYLLPETAEKIEWAAQDRGMKSAQLIRKLLEFIARDEMYEAVIDGD